LRYPDFVVNGEVDIVTRERLDLLEARPGRVGFGESGSTRALVVNRFIGWSVGDVGGTDAEVGIRFTETARLRVLLVS